MASVYKPNEKGQGKPKRGAKWRLRFKNEHGVWKDVSSGTTCKQTALAEANRLEAEGLKRRSGLIDRGHEQRALEARKPVSAHVSSYQAKLANAGRSDKHVSDEVSVLKRFFNDQQLQHLGDIRPDHVQSYVSNLVASQKANRTVQKHITTLRSFFNWLIGQDKILENPTRGIEKPSPSRDRRHKRRMLSRDEWSWLASVTVSEADRWCMSGDARRLLYWTAIETGYRSNELRQIRKSHLRSLAGKHFISVDGVVTKNGKAAKQYLSPSLAAELSDYAKEKSNADCLFAMPSSSNVVRMLRDDLKAAKEAWCGEVQADPREYGDRLKSDFLSYSDHEGRKLDFHSLRHTCGAWLVIAGVDVKTVQTVMRHSTPTLTLNTYGHLLEGAESRAVEAAKVAPQQIHSKLAANQGDIGATECEGDQFGLEPINAKSPQKTEGFANGCKTKPVFALAPPPGLEPGTHGLTVHCSTN